MLHARGLSVLPLQFRCKKKKPGENHRACNYLILLVGARGFEPPTPRSRTECSTRLSHAPTEANNHLTPFPRFEAQLPRARLPRIAVIVEPVAIVAVVRLVDEDRPRE